MDEQPESWLLYILICAFLCILVIFPSHKDEEQPQQPQPYQQPYQRQQAYNQQDYYQQRYQHQYYQKQPSRQQNYQQEPAWPRLPVTVPQPYPPVRQLPSPPAEYQPTPLAQRRLSNSYPVYIDDSLDVEPRESAYYQQLRTRAREEGDAMAKAFDASKIAYQNGERARAKELSNEGKKHKAEMERLNKEAGDWVFKQNNAGSASGVIDLHGLFVKEAIEKAETAVQAAQARGDVQIRIIVGKGLHSQGAARIKPAIEELMIKHQLNVQIDPRNAGVLVVQLGGRSRSRMDPYDVMLGLEEDDERW